MTSWPEFRMATRTLPFLQSHVDSPDGSVRVRGGPAPRLLVWDPELIDWIFGRDGELRHPGGRSLTPLFGQLSLLWAEGSRHAAYRQVLGPPLRGRGLAEQHGTVADAVHSAIDALTAGTTVELLAWTRGIALRVIARLLLGQVDDELLAAVTGWIERAFGVRYRTLAYRYLLGGLPRPGAELDHRLVRAARASTDTLATRLLAGGGPLGTLDDAELRDAVISLLFAGHETTAAATAWTLFWLDRNPAIRDQVRAELAATGSDGSDLTAVPLLTATVDETLRLTPPATLAEHRVLTTATPEFAAGTMLTPAMYIAHRRPDVFPNPNRFDPNRFLGRRPPARHYFPFGGGTRYCLGSQLAQLEVRMVVAALLRRREWRCVNSHLGVARMRGNVLAPARGLRLRVLACRD
jgi:cytochrome P450